MNVAQLHTGSVNIGYFFLLVILAAAFTYILTRSVQPTEAFWKKASRSYALNEYEDEDGYDGYAMHTIIWGWFRHRYGVFQKFHAALSKAKLRIGEAIYGEDNDDAYQLFAWRAIWWIFRHGPKQAVLSLRLRLRSLRSSSGPGAQQDAASSRPVQQDLASA